MRKRSFLQTYKVIDFIVAFSFLAGVSMLVVYFSDESERKIVGGVKLIDGDSLHVDGEEIRLIGIDAPESRQFCLKGGKPWPCGRDSFLHLRHLISGERVNCKGRKRDKYDRLLAKCYVGKVELNRRMVRDGWAVSFGDYEREEAEAERENKGMWVGDFDRPQDWRRHERSVDQWSN